MTFEETLAALQGMIGKDVKISVGAASGSPAIIGAWEGRLAAATDSLGPIGADGGTEALYFHLARDLGSGFFLHAETFRGARWIVDESEPDPVLEIISGPLALLVESASG